MPLILPGNVGSATAATGYNVDNSLRFNDGSSDYLNKTYGSAGNRKTWTFSAWFKLSSGGGNTIFSSYTDGNNWTDFYFSGTNKFEFVSYASGYLIHFTSSQVFRDYSAWTHIVLAFDTTQSTASDRIKLYVNGSQVTALDNNTYPNQNSDHKINSTDQHRLGLSQTNAAISYDGYMAEVCFIDGSQLAPTEFGEFDEDSGIWKPIDVSGLTFGTNGFYLDFEDSGALGDDVSGNGNDFTVNNLTSIDQSTDTCTNNFATLNPLNSTGNGTEPTYSEGNLQSVSPSSSGGFVGSSTIGVSTGKWFFELQRSAGTSTNVYIGIGDEEQTREIARQSASAVFIGNAVYYKPDDGNKVVVTNGSGAETSYGATYGNGDIIGIALNMDDNQVTFYKNGASQGVISIPTPDGFCFLNIVNGADTADTFQINFGSPPYSISSGNSDGNGYGNFEYAVPSGYYALNTKNLSEFG